MCVCVCVCFFVCWSVCESVSVCEWVYLYGFESLLVILCVRVCGCLGLHLFVVCVCVCVPLFVIVRSLTSVFSIEF